MNRADLKAAGTLLAVTAMLAGLITFAMYLVGRDSENAARAKLNEHRNEECRSAEVPSELTTNSITVTGNHRGLFACWLVEREKHSHVVCARLTRGDPLWCSTPPSLYR